MSKKIIENCHSVINMAIKEANKANGIHKLGAVITKGRKKFICGNYNHNQRTSYFGEISCCQHAEMAVIGSFLNMHVKPSQCKVSCAFL